MTPQHPLVLGHRGMGKGAGENTIASFLAAKKAGADGIEFDVQLSDDNILFVYHDLENTYKFSEITRRHPNVEIPTLRDVLLHPEVSTMKLLNLELKSPGCAKAVMPLLEELKLETHYLISSFNFKELETAYMASQNDKHRFGLLLNKPTSLDTLPSWIIAVNPSESLLKKDDWSLLHELSKTTLQIFAYDVTKENTQWLLDHGVNIITDYLV